MKKIFLILTAFISLAISANAQVNVSKDTSFTTECRDNVVKPMITLSNTSNSVQTVTWNLDLSKTIIPSGYEFTGICFLPGLCYAVSNASHTETLDPLKNGILEPEVNITSVARLDSSAFIVIDAVINGVSKKIHFKITAADCALSTASITKPSRINLEMYPLPAKNKLNVIHNNNKVAKAVLFNVLGKKIMEYYTPANANGFSINTSDLADGMYIIDVRDNNNHSLATQRFTKN